jgi:hypothetical protein
MQARGADSSPMTPVIPAGVGNEAATHAVRIVGWGQVQMVPSGRHAAAPAVVIVVAGAIVEETSDQRCCC